jgi:hypothetical protein
VRFVLQDAFEDPEDLQAFLEGLAVASDGTSGSSAEGDPTPGTRIPESGGEVDVATIVLGAGFTLLRLTGHIDSEGRGLVLAALRVLEDFYGPQREFDVMRRDVEAFV